MIKLLAAAEVRTREILRWLRDSRIYPEIFGEDDVFLTAHGKLLRMKELDSSDARLLWVPTKEQLKLELVSRGWNLDLKELDKSTWLAILTRPGKQSFYLEGAGHDEEHAVLSVLERWKTLLVPELIGDAA